MNLLGFPTTTIIIIIIIIIMGFQPLGLFNRIQNPFRRLVWL